MAKNNKVARAITRAQKTQERIAALEAALLEEEREADRVLGEAVRQAVDNPRSKWADHTNLTVKEFYSLVVGGEVGGDAPSDGEATGFGDSDGVAHHQSPEDRASVHGDGVTDEVGGSQGF